MQLRKFLIWGFLPHSPNINLSHYMYMVLNIAYKHQLNLYVIITGIDGKQSGVETPRVPLPPVLDGGRGWYIL